MKDDKTMEIEHRGWLFESPFHCFYCGDIISADQFAFSRACGGCAVGYSRTWRVDPMSHKVFAGKRTQVGKPGDRWFINPEWINPAERERYPPLPSQQPTTRSRQATGKGE
jgi:hypothetical protein